jgi:rhamnosyltransferase
MHSVVSIVVTYHPDEAALGGIRSLAEQTRHVIVVDNSGDEETSARLKLALGASPETFTLLLNTENLGIAAALNRGMRHAETLSAEWVLTMDQDSRITPGMVDALLSTYRQLPDDQRSHVASLTPTLALRTEYAAGTAVPPTSAQYPHRDVATAITSGNLVKWSAWQTVGGYDEKLFIDYVDHDFSFRLRRAGYRIVACESATLLHAIGNARLCRLPGHAVMVDQHSPLRYYYMTRNGFYFWRTYAGADPFLREDKINALKLFLKALVVDTRRLERLRMFWRGYRDFRAGRFGRYPASPA